jgi:dihydroorotate dehydrogenase
MYKAIIRPILFKTSPERVHHLIIGLIKFAFIIPFLPRFVRRIFTIKNPLLERNIAGLKFPNPVGLAAGFDKNASFYNQFASFGFGFIEIGTVTPRAQPGNPKPRSFRLKADKALINRMGFNNHGVKAAKKKLSKKHNLIIGGNIGKNTATSNDVAYKDYLTVFRELYNLVDYFVVNVSCPNISDLAKLQDQDMLEQILDELIKHRSQQAESKPIFLKVSPDLNPNQVDETLDIVAKTNIDGLVVANTTVSRENLVTDTETVKNIGNGGLSGLPIRDRSTEMIRYIHEKTKGKLPIIGVGGIMSAKDALDKLNAGASLIQVYTGFIYEGPALVKRINKAILKKDLSS